jgi:hypothetical protein
MFRPAAAVTATIDRMSPMPPIPVVDDLPKDGTTPTATDDMLVPVSLTEIEAAARALAEAAATVEEARAPLAAAQAHRDKIAARLDALEAQCVAIVSRRAAGDEQDDDGARLALIAADTEGLKGLLVQAEAALAAPRAIAEQAQRALASVKLASARAEAEAQEVALTAHATMLDQLLVTTLDRLSEASRGIGRPTHQWQPSRQLADAIRRLDLRRKG